MYTLALTVIKNVKAMTESKLTKKYEGKATYQITIQGKVDPNFIERFSGFSVTHIETESKTLSTLTGKIEDQEALSGLLNVLFDYQYKIISVLKLDN